MSLSPETCSNLQSSLRTIESQHARLVELLFQINETGSSKLFIEAQELKRQIESGFEAIESSGIETKEMKELFGNYCIGPADIERNATLRNGTKAIEISASEKIEANLMLAQKLNEPDVKAFIDHLRTNEADRNNWMLIYCPKGGMLQSLDSSHRAGVNIEAMVNVLDADSRADNPSVPLIFNGMRAIESTPETSLPHGWMFVQKEVVTSLDFKLSTIDKEQNEQTLILEKEAARLKLKTANRPSPSLLTYSLIMAFKNTGNKHMRGIYSRTNTLSGRSTRFCVGFFDDDGADVLSRSSSADSDIGASFAR